jgi:hypothetical protein
VCTFCAGRLPALQRCAGRNDAARYALNAWKSVPLGRFSAATSFELRPTSWDFPPVDFQQDSAGKISARFQSAAPGLISK